MQLLKKLNWNVVYFAFLALVSLYAVLFSDEGAGSYAAMPLFTYIAVSLIAFGFFTVAQFFIGLASSIRNGSASSLAVSILISGVLFIFLLWNTFSAAALYHGLDEATRNNLTSLLGFFLFSISVLQMLRNPEARFNTFDFTRTAKDVTGLAGRMNAFVERLANRLLSASLPGIFSFMVFSFLVLHASKINSNPLGVDFFLAILIGISALGKVYPQKNAKDFLYAILTIISIGVSYAALIGFSFGLWSLSRAVSPNQYIAFSSFVVYVLFVLMFVKGYPKWYFYASEFGWEGKRHVSIDVLRNQMSPKQREEIGYAQPGQRVQLVVGGKIYWVEKLDEGYDTYEQL